MNGWEFQPARDRDLHGIERHRSLQRERSLASSVYQFWWGTLRIIFRVWNRLRVSGEPPYQPTLRLIDHSSHLDAPLLASLLPAKWRDQGLAGRRQRHIFRETPDRRFRRLVSQRAPSVLIGTGARSEKCARPTASSDG
jgi:hypothetical protein